MDVVGADGELADNVMDEALDAIPVVTGGVRVVVEVGVAVTDAPRCVDYEGEVQSTICNRNRKLWNFKAAYLTSAASC